MKKQIFDYVKVAARLPFAMLGGVLAVAASATNAVAYMALGDTETAQAFLSKIK